MDTVVDRVPLRGGEVELARPRDAEALLSEEAFSREELLPYWAQLWSSAPVLAGEVAAHALRGRRVLELGCGLGLPSIAAVRAGGRVTATDWSPEAVRATRANAERNAVELEALVCSWGEPEPLVRRAPWDLVLASDVLYERRNVDLLLELLPRLSREAWIADPGRAPAQDFLDRAAERWTRSTVKRGPVAVHRLRPRACASGGEGINLGAARPRRRRAA